MIQIKKGGLVKSHTGEMFTLHSRQWEIERKWSKLYTYKLKEPVRTVKANGNESCNIGKEAFYKKRLTFLRSRFGQLKKKIEDRKKLT
ncbi:hypothetical protein JTB14_036166 [Gonioctena quinquepunctata]|nr:hypothetical protein JTB14_036166 [Gonioctena quinquepunctata]